MRCRPTILSALLFGLVTPALSDEPVELQGSESRALAFLKREVPQWSAENNCFSCHNNGEGARALYTAARLGHPIDRETLADTTDWLTRPRDWEHNGGEGEFSDKTLAALQFAASLAAAKQAGIANDPKAFREAARLVADARQPNGSWKPDGPDAIGSPATWGRPLATAMARHALAVLAPQRHAAEVRGADRWLRAKEPKTVLDGAALLIGLGGSTDDAAQRQRARCIEIIRAGKSEEGGWGPYVTSAPEPFDTAAVLIALARNPRDASTNAMIARGRAYLRSMQSDDGDWPETTRPPGAVSYAQRLSTTGWATQALLLTKP